MAKTVIIHGDKIHDIPSFYEEINRLFMENENWNISQSLDALNDLFYGGFGMIAGKEEIELVWENFEQNRQDLGWETTLAYYHNKLKSPSTFNTEFVRKKIADLENGTGQTYFDIILEIISEHPNIKLQPK